MRNKYGIGFIVITIVALMIVTGAYQLSFQKAKEHAEVKVTEEEQDVAVATPEPTIAADGQALKEDCYYLMEVNGYVVVYLSDKKTPYEYTDILYEELPDSLQDEIRNGKYIEDVSELYGFLENYSS